MTEFWKSYDKKYCDVCKCWIADNKISVSVHEGGKKHQENVKNKIKDLVKKSSKELKDKKKLDSEMQKMEDEAMQAYLRDIADNPDMSSDTLKDKIQAKLEEEKAEEPSKKKLKMPRPSKEKPVEPKPPPVWYETKSDEGHTYYWNTVTNDTCWEPPSEGFVSLQAQKDMEEKKTLAAEETKKEMDAAFQRSQMEAKYKDKIEENIRFQKENEEAAAAYREEVKAGTASIGPPKKPCGPYGAWTSVPVSERPITLELPEPPPPEPVPVFVPVRDRIKEKTWEGVSLSNNSGPVQFKKRKFGGNVRQRLEDD